MNRFMALILVFAHCGSALALEATHCDGNCGTDSYVAGTVNKPLFDLSDALKNDPSLNGTQRVAVNHDQTPVRLPITQIRRGDDWLSGGYVSPCLILTAKHGILNDRNPLVSGPKAIISSETDSTGKAINYRETEIIPLDDQAGDLILLRDPSCAGERVGYFRFVRLPPTEGKVRDFRTLFAAFPFDKGFSALPDKLVVTKCNSKFQLKPWEYHDCEAVAGTSGGFLMDSQRVQENGKRSPKSGLNIFFARGIHLARRASGTFDDCDITTCNKAVDGGTVAILISKYVDKDLEDFIARKESSLVSKNRDLPAQ